jgi:hypothetical protein
MKHISFIAVLALIWGSPAGAESSGRDIPPFPSSCSTTPYGESCLHTFGGAWTRVPLPQEECRGEKVELYQLSSRLSVPAGKPIAPERDSCSATVYLPNVRRTQVFRLADVENDEADGRSQSVLVTVYPADILKDLQEWSHANRLIVNDRESRLIPLLEENDIAYSPVMLPSGNHTQQVCVWVPASSAPADEEAPLECLSLLVLHEKSATLPYISIVHAQGQVRTDVYMPLLPDFSSSPLVQKTFVDLIQSQL